MISNSDNSESEILSCSESDKNDKIVSNSSTSSDSSEPASSFSREYNLDKVIEVNSIKPIESDTGRRVHRTRERGCVRGRVRGRIKRKTQESSLRKSRYTYKEPTEKQLEKIRKRLLPIDPPDYVIENDIDNQNRNTNRGVNNIEDRYNSYFRAASDSNPNRRRVVKKALNNYGQLNIIEQESLDFADEDDSSSSFSCENTENKNCSQVQEFDLSRTFETYDLAFSELMIYLSQQNTHIVTISKKMSDHIKFTCRTKYCQCEIRLSKINEKWIFNYFVDHTCFDKSKGHKITKNEIDDAINDIGGRKTTSIDVSLPKLIRDKLGVDEFELPDCRIWRRNQIINGDSTKERKKSWNKLVSLVNYSKENGGDGSIVANEENAIFFAGMMPEYAKQFIQSTSFFPVILADGTFQKAIGHGVLIIIVTLTGNRTVLPLCWGWAETENKVGCQELFKYLKPMENLIETVFEDGGTALNSVTESLNDVFLALCAWHVKNNIPRQFRSIFWKYVKGFNLESKKIRNIIETEPEYANLLKIMKDKWHLLNKFAGTGPRFDLDTTSTMESFNGAISSYKKKEPFDVFKKIFLYGRDVLKNLHSLTGYLMPVADRYIKEAMIIAFSLPQPKKVGDLVSITIRKGQKSKIFDIDMDTLECSCHYRTDCGLPCPHLLRAILAYGDKRWACLIHKCYFVSEFKKNFPNLPKMIPFGEMNDSGNYKPPCYYTLRGRLRRIKRKEELQVEKSKDN